MALSYACMGRRKQILYFVLEPKTINTINEGQGFTGTGLKPFLVSCRILSPQASRWR